MEEEPAQPASLGLLFTLTARSIERAFDGALASSGGSTSTWLILMTLMSGGCRSQRELAEAVGLRGATLSHHLNAMEADGLLTRRRERTDRRHHLVDLTENGRAQFYRLRHIAIDFDAALRAHIATDELAGFTHVLTEMRNNVAGLSNLTRRLERTPRAPAHAP